MGSHTKWWPGKLTSHSRVSNTVDVHHSHKGLPPQQLFVFIRSLGKVQNAGMVFPMSQQYGSCFPMLHRHADVEQELLAQSSDIMSKRRYQIRLKRRRWARAEPFKRSSPVHDVCNNSVTPVDIYDLEELLQSSDAHALESGRPDAFRDLVPSLANKRLRGREAGTHACMPLMHASPARHYLLARPLQTTGSC